MSKKSNHKEGLPALAEGREINFIERDGEILFTAEEVGRQLGYSEPRAVINLFNKNQNELKHYSTIIETITVDNKSREVRCFTEEGVYLVSMLARTNEAKRFRAKVALLLREIRQRKLTTAREAALHEGRAQALAAIRALSPTQRSVLERASHYRRQGLTLVEIAKLLGCCKETVGRTLRKADALGLLAPATGEGKAPAMRRGAQS